MKFIKTHANGLQCKKPSFGDCTELSELFDHAIDVFSHVLPYGEEFTAKQFAEKIKETYDIRFPRNRIIYEFINCLDDMQFAYRSREEDMLVVSGMPSSSLNEQICSTFKNALNAGELVSLEGLHQRL